MEHSTQGRGPWICEFCGFRVNNNGPEPDVSVMCCDERRAKEFRESLERSGPEAFAVQPLPYGSKPISQNKLASLIAVTSAVRDGRAGVRALDGVIDQLKLVFDS